jgi:hypothetical protein
VGFSFRKTSKSGPFRVTAPKSGISYSAGGKGMRVAKRADGQVQSAVPVPGTGMHYPASITPIQRPAAQALPSVPQDRNASPTGKWYFVITVFSVGLLAWIPFAHAASRLERKDILLRAGLYGLAALLVLIIAGVTPTDARGNPVGGTGHALSSIAATIAIILISVGCYQLTALRKAVYGAERTQPPSTATADPAITAYLAGRSRRDESRALAQGDPVIAHDLSIGRPDIPSRFNDGGLVDLNSAPAAVIAKACAIDSQTAQRIAASRQQLGSFSSMTEVFAFAEVNDAAAIRILEYGVLIPR